MQLFLELASGGTGEGDAGEIYVHWIHRRPSSGPEAPGGCPVLPLAQLLRGLDTAFPARSPGFAEVCAPIRKRRDGGGLEGQEFGSPF